MSEHKNLEEMANDAHGTHGHNSHDSHGKTEHKEASNPFYTLINSIFSPITAFYSLANDLGSWCNSALSYSPSPSKHSGPKHEDAHATSH